MKDHVKIGVRNGIAIVMAVSVALLGIALLSLNSMHRGRHQPLLLAIYAFASIALVASNRKLFTRKRRGR